MRAGSAAANTAGKERVAAPQLTWFRTVREESRMGIGCGSEGSKTLLQSACPIVFRCRQEIHEVAGCFPVFLILERHVEVWGGPEHVQERPQCKVLAPVLLKLRKSQLCALKSVIAYHSHRLQKQSFVERKGVRFTELEV